jgi:hypothetical protein
MVRARPRQQFVFARRGLAMMPATRWILPFTCLRRWCVAKLSLDRQPQHFYYYLYSVKITNLGKISASRSSSAAVRAASAEGSRCRLELRIRLSYLTTEAATRMSWIKRTSDMPRAFGGSGFSEKWGAQRLVCTVDSLRPLSDIEKRRRDSQNFNDRSADGREIGSYAQAALPKSIIIRLFDKVI